MRAGPLSDDRVIQAVNEHFVPVEVNVTRDGFPVEAIPAMTHYQRVYQQNWRFEFGFANCSAVEETGTIPLGMAKPKNLSLSGYMTAENYLDFIAKAINRFQRVCTFLLLLWCLFLVLCQLVLFFSPIFKIRSAKLQIFQGNFLGGGQQISILVQEIVAEVQQEVVAVQQFQQALGVNSGGLAEFAAAQNQSAN